MLNYQGKAGLGMGFASFIAGEIGQRIILKSGLVPVKIPSRNIIVRKEINNKQ
jgi:phosphate transport system substrate-binding protein